MKSSELFSHPHLFSHPYEPEVVPNTDRDSEAVQLPIFSDHPQSDSTAATPPS
jgi:hypothetical protein